MDKEILEHSYITGDNVKWYSRFTNSFEVSQKVKYKFAVWPRISFLVAYLREMKMLCPHKIFDINIHSNITETSPKQEITAHQLQYTMQQ